jgi:uncharacterized protein (TIGR00251 family)
LTEERLATRVAGTSVRFAVHVQPRASRSEIVGLHGSALKVRLSAPPVDNAANEALVRMIAEALRVPRSSVRVVAGQTSRAKTIEVDGVGTADAERLVVAIKPRGGGGSAEPDR